MRKVIAKKVTYILLVVTIIYCAFIVFLVISKGYKFSDIDWNSDGSTTLIEIIKAKDIGVRKVDENCDEFYQLKDGLPVKSICNK